MNSHAGPPWSGLLSIGENGPTGAPPAPSDTKPCRCFPIEVAMSSCSAQFRLHRRRGTGGQVQQGTSSVDLCITRTPGALMVIDQVPAAGWRAEGLVVVFDDGQVGDRPRWSWPATSCSHAFITPDQLGQFLRALQTRRALAALHPAPRAPRSTSRTATRPTRRPRCDGGGPGYWSSRPVSV